MTDPVEPALDLEVLELEGKLATADHFALLGVKKGASADEVKKAFYQLSRRLHPDRHFRRATPAFKARLLKVFRVLSKAHRTLTHPGLRETYLNEHPELKPPPPPKMISTKHNKRMAWNTNALGPTAPGVGDKKDK